MKSELRQATITYLGHVVGQGRMEPNKAKIQIIIEYPQPMNKKKSRDFSDWLGLIANCAQTCL